MGNEIDGPPLRCKAYLTYILSRWGGSKLWLTNNFVSLSEKTISCRWKWHSKCGGDHDIPPTKKRTWQWSSIYQRDVWTRETFSRTRNSKGNTSLHVMVDDGPSLMAPFIVYGIHPKRYKRIGRHGDPVSQICRIITNDLSSDRGSTVSRVSTRRVGTLRFIPRCDWGKISCT